MNRLSRSGRWFVAALLVGTVAFAAAVAGRRTSAAALSLVDDYPSTIRRSLFPDVETFSVVDATVAGETRRAVYARAPSRLTWRVALPAARELRAWIALRTESWTMGGDGVVFRIGLSDGHGYRELFNRLVNPAGKPEDRAWIPVAVALPASQAGQVELIFNTDRGVPNGPASGAGDLALWGEPTVVAAR
jgi:hypothetical protein